MLDLEAQKLIVDGKLRCWFDIDVNDTRAAYQRAVDFVGAKNLAYNLSSVCGTTGLYVILALLLDSALRLDSLPR